MTEDGKKLGEFDLVDRLARNVLQKQNVCLYYRKEDSTADPSSPRGECGQLTHLPNCVFALISSAVDRLLADDHFQRWLPPGRRTVRAQWSQR